MGIDVGSKNIGIAVSDAMNTIANGRPTIRMEQTDFDKAIDVITDIIDNEDIGRVVVGHPKNMDGSTGPQADVSASFKEKLEKKTDCPVVLWDERLTSKMAHDVMRLGGKSHKKQKQHVDRLAAVLILQSYLDAGKDDE
jgi:putative Holliday junction resolvase